MHPEVLKLIGLKRESDDATDQYRSVETSRDREIFHARERVTSEINEKYSGQLRELSLDSSAALNEYLEARVAAALAGRLSGVQPGTVMVRWQKYWLHERWTKSEDRGLVGVFVRGDEYGGHWRRQPQYGTLVVRLLLKNGKPGKKIESFHVVKDEQQVPPHGWYPEGVDPNNEVKRAEPV